MTLAGFFGFFDYTKPGKGVNKDEPKKKGILRFFELFFRKFWNYMKLNLLYMITCIPAFLFYTYILLYLFGGNVEPDLAWAMLFLAAAGAITLITFLGGSPFAAGFNYVLRNYVREEHAWVFSDFLEHTKKNLKQSLFVFFTDLIIVTVILFNIRFYFLASASNIWMTALLVLVAFLFMIFLIMHTFIWTMMVTFRLKIGQIYRNAFLLTILRLFRNIGGFILIFALSLVLLTIQPIIGILIMILIGFSMFGLINHMICYPTIKKYMLDLVEGSEEENLQDETVSDDSQKIPTASSLNNLYHDPNDIAHLFDEPPSENPEKPEEDSPKQE